MLERVNPKYIARTYGIEPTGDVAAFLEALGKKMGRLRKGGEVDYDEVARSVIRDFLRGNLPWFTPPPETELEQGADGGEGFKERRRGRQALKVGGRPEGREDEEDQEDEEEEYQGIPDDDEVAPTAA